MKILEVGVHCRAKFGEPLARPGQPGCALLCLPGDGLPCPVLPVSGVLWRSHQRRTVGNFILLLVRYTVHADAYRYVDLETLTCRMR